MNSRKFRFAALTLASSEAREFLQSSDVIHPFELLVYLLQGTVLTFLKHLGFSNCPALVLETSHSHLNLNIEELLSSPYSSFSCVKFLL
jgi:hypothetical protein